MCSSCKNAREQATAVKDNNQQRLHQFAMLKEIAHQKYDERCESENWDASCLETLHMVVKTPSDASMLYVDLSDLSILPNHRSHKTFWLAVRSKQGKIRRSYAYYPLADLVGVSPGRCLYGHVCIGRSYARWLGWRQPRTLCVWTPLRWLRGYGPSYMLPLQTYVHYPLADQAQGLPIATMTKWWPNRLYTSQLTSF